MNVICRYGSFSVPNGDDLIVESLRRYGEWAQNEIDILANFIKSGQVVVDAGAFLGTHARAFSTLVGASGEVHAFEPNNFILPYLEQNALESEFPNIFVHRHALGGVSTRKPLMNTSGNNNGASHIDEVDGAVDDNIVDILPLDVSGLHRVDFIKGDVEGMELALLIGADTLITKFKPVVAIETNSLNASYGVLEWAKSKGYAVFGVITTAFNPQNYNYSTENMFGEAKECTLILIHSHRVMEHMPSIYSCHLPEIKTVDDLALLLLHKPQYPQEILAKSSVSTLLGLDFITPGSNGIKEKDIELANLKSLLDTVEKAKDYAEKLAVDRLEEISNLQRRLDRVEHAKEYAERLAFERLSEIDQLQSLLRAITESIPWKIIKTIRLDRSTRRANHE